MRDRTSRAVAGVALAVLALTACGDEAVAPREGTLVQDLVGDEAGQVDLASAEAGEEVTLRADVETVLSPGSFVVPGKDTGGVPLLVLHPGQEVTAGQVLQLGGTLQLFSYDELAGEYDLAPEGAYADVDGGLVLLASLVDDDLPLDDR